MTEEVTSATTSSPPYEPEVHELEDKKTSVVDEPEVHELGNERKSSVEEPEVNKLGNEKCDDTIVNEAKSVVEEPEVNELRNEKCDDTIVNEEKTVVEEPEIHELGNEKCDDTIVNEAKSVVEEPEVVKPSVDQPAEEKHELTATEKLVTESMIITPTSPTTPIFAPLNIPLYRRRQTLVVLTWFLVPWFCLFLSLMLLRSNNWYLVGAFIVYLTWMTFFQKFPREGGIKQEWFRRLKWWKWGAEFFPIYLHKTCDLPPDRSYIFCYHPHGIISLGACFNFATEGTGFSEKYPGINLRLLTLQVNFRIPFYGIYLGMLGICDASKESCNYVLKKGNGHSIGLVLGGAKESLDARPSQEYILTLKNRKGFIRIGLANGASLVPIFSFGENDLYDQIANPRGSRLRNIQAVIQKRLGVATPFFKGRGIFQYAVGFLPVRHAVNTYVGAPIHLPKLDPEKITTEIVDKYHQEYMEALKELFNTYKAKHGNEDATIIFVDDSD